MIDEKKVLAVVDTMLSEYEEYKDQYNEEHKNWQPVDLVSLPLYYLYACIEDGRFK